MHVTRAGGFTLRRVFYTVPSRMVGHRLRVRLYDDRLMLYTGTEHLVTLPRGHAGPKGQRGRVVDYRHVLPSLRFTADGDAEPGSVATTCSPATRTTAPLKRCAKA